MAVEINNKDFIQAVHRLKAEGVIKRDSDIAESMGYAKNTLSEYLNNKRAVSDAFLKKFYESFPKAAKVRKSDPFANGQAIDMGSSLVMMVPLVSKYAYAGYQAGYGDDEYIEELPKVPFLVDKEYKGIYRAFEVKGDSMDNGLSGSYKEGFIVLGREIGKDLWRDKFHLRKWKNFIVVTKKDGVLIKEISKHDTEKGIITLHSLNPQFPDVDYKLNNVNQLFNVIKFLGE